MILTGTYVCDFRGNCVKVLSSQGEHFYSFSEKGSTSNRLSKPHSICVDSNFVYVSECGNHCVSVFTKKGEFITSFGKAGSKDGHFESPSGLAIDGDGYLYVCDLFNNHMQVF